MQINRVGILGAGTMGQGIAQLCTEAGLCTVITDSCQHIVDKAVQSIINNWDHDRQKGKKGENEVNQYKSLLLSSIHYSSFADCQIIIEAITENITAKQTAFKELDELCAVDTIFTSSTSTLSITEIASVTNRTDKVVGVHFFYPVTAMPLVEIVPSIEANPVTIQQVIEFVQYLGKEPIVVKESTGFVVNRLLISYINEAAIIYSQGIASADEIDTAMKLGANMLIGPLALADLIGIDVCCKTMDCFWQETGDSKYKPALSLKQKVRAKALGLKTGKGFFNYSK